jgi:hypothetical protein
VAGARFGDACRDGAETATRVASAGRDGADGSAVREPTVPALLVRNDRRETKSPDGVRMFWVELSMPAEEPGVPDWVKAESSCPMALGNRAALHPLIARCLGVTGRDYGSVSDQVIPLNPGLRQVRGYGSVTELSHSLSDNSHKAVTVFRR